MIKRDVVALLLAAGDRRTPWVAKVVAGAAAAYALSPIDLIPDFIPILGYLDDLIIVPIGILLAVKLIPAELMTEFRAKALRRSNQPCRLVLIVAIGLFIAITITWMLWPDRRV